MKNKQTNHLMGQWGSALLLLLTPLAVQATSVFNSTVTLTYTIDEIINKTNPGTSDGLTVTGNFMLDQSSSEIFIPVGSDGTATKLTELPDYSVDTVTDSFSHTMHVSGNASNGSLDAAYLGLYELSFENQSADEFEIKLTLDYSLRAEVSGDYAESDIIFDYYNEAGGFESDIDGILAYASAPYDLLQTLPGTASHSFTLAAGEFEAIYADASISGSLEASPVPVPGALILFLSAVMIPVLKRESTH